MEKYKFDNISEEDIKKALEEAFGKPVQKEREIHVYFMSEAGLKMFNDMMKEAFEKEYKRDIEKYNEE